MLKSSILRTINKAINEYLKLDPESIYQLEKLEGKRVAVELLPFKIVIHAAFIHHQIQIDTDSLLPADVTLRGSPLRLLATMQNKKDRHQFFKDDVTIEGNIDIGQQLINLFDQLDVDWEEHLSRWTGDVPAYHVGNAIRKVGAWFRDANESLTDNISDFLHEEAEWMPTREALNDFFNDIDAARMDTDRAEARIKQLKAALNDNETDI